MSDKVQFYYNPMSRGRIVHWMLEEASAPYEIKLLHWNNNDHKSPEYLKINPMGQIPAIVHRGVVVTETAAICAYLADAFPKAGLAPDLGSPSRGAYYRWLFFTSGSAEYYKLDEKIAPEHKMPPGRVGYGNPKDVVNTLETAVANGFLVDNKFSAADVYLASFLGWRLMMKELEPRPAFEKYLKLCHARPAFKRFHDQAEKLNAPSV
jgi:glutathione S-transferase